jgi:VWFA-related protein
MRSTNLRAGLLSLVLFVGLCASSWLPANRAHAASTSPQDGAGGGQAPGGGQQPIKVQVNLVNLFATVRDSHHSFVNNLTKDEFKIYEDGVEQKVAFFNKEVDMPITLALLIDTSGSEQNMLGAEQDAGSRFVHEVMRKKDLAMVMSFDLDANLLADFTEDTSILERALRKTQINASMGGGGTAPTIDPGNIGTVFYDAVYLACHDQLRDQAGRKAVIALTDAEDNGSKMKPGDAIEAAQRSDAVIHIILVTDRRYGFGFGGGFNSGASVAKRMTEDTGGRVIEVHSESHLEQAFDEISQELRQQYVLGYYPTNEKRDGTFRKIKLETTKSEFKVLTRKGYYAPRN